MSDRSFEPPSPRRTQRNQKELCGPGALTCTAPNTVRCKCRGSISQNQKLLIVLEKNMRFRPGIFSRTDDRAPHGQYLLRLALYSPLEFPSVWQPVEHAGCIRASVSRQPSHPIPVRQTHRHLFPSITT